MEIQEYVYLKGIEKTCVGCPTVFEGETVDGKHFYVRFRHNYMRALLDDIDLFDANLNKYADGVCTFDEVKQCALENGVLLEIV